jgi:hypothetical protein
MLQLREFYLLNLDLVRALVVDSLHSLGSSHDE